MLSQGIFCDDPSPVHSERSEESAAPGWSRHLCLRKRQNNNWALAPAGIRAWLQPCRTNAFPAVVLSGVGAYATTESKDPGAASCKDVDSGNFSDDPCPFHSERSEESAAPGWSRHLCLRKRANEKPGFSHCGYLALPLPRLDSPQSRYFLPAGGPRSAAEPKKFSAAERHNKSGATTQITT
jgi:hypothetical protein